ncbi:hypothetical protein [Paenibacillus dokdonensis]|uniref:hypothetical protein n=1 Tax=Paenibacillus dokdonensis TaxID=2567944 RepID=UPI0010A86C61|nr:hypothetical protein [Paenibacillus dokdonensis]
MRKIAQILCITALLLTACASKDDESKSEAVPTISNTTNITSQPQPTVQPPQPNEADTKQEGFLLIANDGVMFVQWTELDKQLVGQTQTLYVKSDQMVKTNSQNRPFKGIRNGNSVSLTFNDGNVLTGTLEGNELTLVFPDSEGNLNSMVFKPAKVADYNSAVSKLRGEVQEHNANELEIKKQAKAVKEQQEAVANANKNLSRDINELSRLNESLANSTLFEDVLKEYQNHWNEMQEHQKNMKSLASKKPFDSYQLTEVQYALTEVEYDLTSIQYDDTSMEYKVNEITDNITAIKKLMTTTLSDWATLQHAVAANTTDSLKVQFTSKDVEQAVAQAQSKIDSSTGEMKKAQQQAKEFDSKANQLLADSKKYVDGLKATE